jgi:hypothetical protein
MSGMSVVLHIYIKENEYVFLKIEIHEMNSIILNLKRAASDYTITTPVT